MTTTAVLLLRLAGPLQSWGSANAFNRRDTRPEPTKSGVIGLLAAAQGRSRQDPIADLLDLEFGVRIDQPGALLRDYHTVSDYRGVELPSTQVTAAGTQKRSGKKTHVTQRFYLQDAVFVAAVQGPQSCISTLEQAVRAPAFPLALGRRSCVPTGPIVIGTNNGTVESALRQTPWQISDHTRRLFVTRFGKPATVDLTITVDESTGEDTLHDVPVSFDPLHRGFTTRRVRHEWVCVPTGFEDPDPTADRHDPFALLGW